MRKRPTGEISEEMMEKPIQMTAGRSECDSYAVDATSGARQKDSICASSEKSQHLEAKKVWYKATRENGDTSDGNPHINSAGIGMHPTQRTTTRIAEKKGPKTSSNPNPDRELPPGPTKYRESPGGHLALGRCRPGAYAPPSDRLWAVRSQRYRGV